MFSRILIVIVLATTPMLSLIADNDIDTEITVVLTAATYAKATKQERDLVNTLLDLIELETSSIRGMSIVERRQIDLALQELVLSQGMNDDVKTRLQLGKLASAELVLTLTMLEPGASGQQQVYIRIAEALTGKIRGAMVSNLDALELEKSVSQITRYLEATVKTPKLAGITVAVAPIESRAQFDQIRPLELTIRDVITTQLLQAGNYHVLQRTEMQGLMDELDLARSGLVDASTIPDALPLRAGLYQFQGTIDERFDGTERMVAVDAALVHTASNTKVVEIQLETTTKDLPRQLREQVARVHAYLISQSDSQSERDSPSPLALDEAEYLYGQAMRDVSRFIRYGPSGRGYLPYYVPDFRLPKHQRRPRVDADSPLGQHLLSTSIDRLETALFLEPDRRDIAFILAYCHSYHLPGIWQPKRAEQLLLNLIERDSESKLSILAMRLLAEMYVHHEGNGQVAPEHDSLVIDRMRFAMKTLPADQRGMAIHWFSTITKLHMRSGNYAELYQTVSLAGSREEEAEDQSKKSLGWSLLYPIKKLLSDPKCPPDVKAKTLKLIDRWTESERPWLAYHGCKMKAGIADGEQAGYWYLRASKAIENDDSERVHGARVQAVTLAAENFLKADQPQSGLEALHSIEPIYSRNNRGYGLYGMQLGECYEAVGRKREALQTYIEFTEKSFRLASQSDVQERILALGGVPLRDKLDFSLRYIDGPADEIVYSHALATDGKRLFCGGLHDIPKTHIKTLAQNPISGVHMLNIETNQWMNISGMNHHAECLAFHRDALWVGTSDAGVWKYHFETGSWTQISTKDGLPVDHVVSMVPYQNMMFVSVGNLNSTGRTVDGAVVAIMDDGTLRILQKGDRPAAAPNCMVVRGNLLSVVADYGLYEMDITTEQWRRVLDQNVLRIFPGKQALWVSRCRQEITRLGASDEENERFRKAWYPTDFPRNTYSPKFLVERDGQLWFGGLPWSSFKSSGFYRMDTETGDFHIYGPRDGFHVGDRNGFTCYDGVFASDRIWIGTSAGLVSVTPRDSASGEVSNGERTE